MAASEVLVLKPHSLCNWKTSVEVLEVTRWNKLNVADVIKECEDVCSVVFASDSPPGVCLTLHLSEVLLMNLQDIVGSGVSIQSKPRARILIST